MTRLVPVRVLCDGCLTAQARVYCVSARRALCTACSQSQAPHSRAVDLARTATALPFCERCDAAPASTYCAVGNSALCGSCDAHVRAERAVTGKRRAGVSGSSDIASALRQRSVRSAGPGPSLSGSSTPYPSRSPQLFHPSGSGDPMQHHTSLESVRAPSAAYANGAGMYAAGAAGLMGIPSGWPGASSISAGGIGSGGDTPLVSPGEDPFSMSQYFYIAHYQQQRLQQLYMQELREQAAACSPVGAPGDELPKQEGAGQHRVPSPAVCFANGKRGRSPPTRSADEERTTVRKVEPGQEFDLFEANGNGSGEASGGSGGNSGVAYDSSADGGRNGSAEGSGNGSAEWSGSSRRSDVAAPSGLPSSAELTAAAVAAAGEMYLLSSVQAGTSSGNFISPPPDVDPAGLLTAATVAAAGASAAIAADAAAANAATMAATYGSQPKRERSAHPAWSPTRAPSADNCASRQATRENGWTQWAGNGSAPQLSVDVTSSLHTQPTSSGARGSKRSSGGNASTTPDSVVGSSIVGTVTGSLDEYGMPDVCGFEENLDFSQFEHQQAPSRTLPRAYSNNHSNRVGDNE